MSSKERPEKVFGTSLEHQIRTPHGRHFRTSSGRQIETFSEWSIRTFRGRPKDIGGGRPRDVLGNNFCRLGMGINEKYLSKTFI